MFMGNIITQKRINPYLENKCVVLDIFMKTTSNVLTISNGSSSKIQLYNNIVSNILPTHYNLCPRKVYIFFSKSTIPASTTGNDYKIIGNSPNVKRYDFNYNNKYCLYVVLHNKRVLTLYQMNEQIYCIIYKSVKQADREIFGKDNKTLLCFAKIYKNNNYLTNVYNIFKQLNLIFEKYNNNIYYLVNNIYRLLTNNNFNKNDGEIRKNNNKKIRHFLFP